MHRRVIFLDIDGVLISDESMRETGRYDQMGLTNVSRVRIAAEATKSEIVISSSWRNINDWERKIRVMFAESGWPNPPIIGRTPRGHSRGEEIRSWLEENQTEDFVIVDDIIFDMLPGQEAHIIHCNQKIGFSEADQRTIENRWK